MKRWADPTTFKDEGDVKKFVKAVFALVGPDLWYFMPPANGFGRSGIPDFVGWAYGAGFAVETKFGKNTPTANQQREIANGITAGGACWIVNEKNCHDWAYEFAVFLSEAKERGSNAGT